jgi:hypothetical protein
LGRAKQCYAHTIGGVNGNWDELQDKFYLAFFPLSRITALQIELLTLQQKEKETLGTAWARFLSLINTGPNLSLLDHVFLYHFHQVLARKLLSILTYLLEARSHTKSLMRGNPFLRKSLKTPPILAFMTSFSKKQLSQASTNKRRYMHSNPKFLQILLMIRLLKNLPFSEHITLLGMMNPILLFVPLNSRMTFSLMLILGTPYSIPIQHHLMPQIPI